jgi:hypothetical protein
VVNDITGQFIYHSNTNLELIQIFVSHLRISHLVHLTNTGMGKVQPTPAFLPEPEALYLLTCFKIENVTKLNHKVKWLTQHKL